ncbi:MAG: Histone H1-like protein HC1 [Candidatus Anoxychlamydiales bacterium]|nr:Histone H1-like protein HC1 [Candidatus Anoxychlamydiales bacterium]
MALQKTIENLQDLLDHIKKDLSKSQKGNKTASQRVRTNTIKLEKIAKKYRKESIKNELKLIKEYRRDKRKKYLSKKKATKIKK